MWHVVWWPRFFGVQWERYDGNPSALDPAGMYRKGDWAVAVGFGFVSIAYRSTAKWTSRTSAVMQR